MLGLSGSVQRAVAFPPDELRMIMMLLLPAEVYQPFVPPLFLARLLPIIGG